MILKSYMWTAPSWFTLDEVAQIHEHAQTVPLHDAMTGNQQEDPDAESDEGNLNAQVRQSKVKWFTPEYRMPQNIVDRINEACVLGMQECGWNFNLGFIENFQYTIYDFDENKPTGDFYTWHTDHGGEVRYENNGAPLQEPGHRKISMTIQLSDPNDYEGGKFQWLEPNRQFDRIQWGDKKINLDESIKTLPFSAQQKGSICLFPSFLYHQVTPVTRGTRISIVGWYNGPQWT